MFSGLANYGEMNPMIVESIVIANGSIKGYLNDNFETYIQNQDMVDEILDMDVQMLPEIIHDYNYE